MESSKEDQLRMSIMAGMFSSLAGYTRFVKAPSASLHVHKEPTRRRTVRNTSLSIDWRLPCFKYYKELGGIE